MADIRAFFLLKEVIKPAVNGMLNIMRSCLKARTLRCVVFTSSAGTSCHVRINLVLHQIEEIKIIPISLEDKGRAGAGPESDSNSRRKEEHDAGSLFLFVSSSSAALASPSSLLFSLAWLHKTQKRRRQKVWQLRQR
ncbi:Dihydroflavonol-4-reductase [Nymphaea thermarum]|nr:Dihydroflavonol-4-reductase [Nymphaea thermarum]